MQEYKPCPFCGSSEASWGDHPITCYLRMIELEETGERSFSVTEFRDAWNRRNTPQDTRR